MAWNRGEPIQPIAGTEQKASPGVPGIAKVSILVPHNHEQDYRHWGRWFDTKLERVDGTSYFETRGLPVNVARTQLVELALKQDITHIFFLDDDVIAPNDVITTLLSANLHIVCGLYMAKKEKGLRGLSAWVRGENGYLPISDKQDGRYISVDVTGLGCAMIHRSIFERISKPWFAWDSPSGPSEDFFFMEKVARELSIKPIVDMNVRCLHLGFFAMDTNDEFSTLEM